MHRDVLKIGALLTALLLPAAPAVAQAGSPCLNGRVALVNSQAILASIPEYVQAESLLAKEVDSYKADLAKQQSVFDSARMAYSDKATLLTSSQKAAEVKKLQDQNDLLQKHAADLDAKVNARQTELLQPIQVRVQDVLDGIRAELNCAIIFDVPGAAIASADKSLNLTDRVIDRLKAASGAPAKPAEKPAAKPTTGGGITPPGGGGGGGFPPATPPTHP